MTDISDKELAESIHMAAEKLNELSRTAKRLGLNVNIQVQDIYDFPELTTCVVDVSVWRFL